MWGGTYFLSGKLHLNVGVHQVSVLAYESLLHICHDAGVHFRKSLGAVDPHIKPSPLPLCWDALREQEVPANKQRHETSFRDKIVELLITFNSLWWTFLKLLCHYFYRGIMYMFLTTTTLFWCEIWIILSTIRVNQLTLVNAAINIQ